jgi:hypothetical protein
VESAKICLESGKLAGDLCTRTATEVFIAGTEPQTKCDIHAVVAEVKPDDFLPPEKDSAAQSHCRSAECSVKHFADQCFGPFVTTERHFDGGWSSGGGTPFRPFPARRGYDPESFALW